MGTELGTAIVTPKKYFKSYETYETDATDESNAYGHLKVIDNTVIYYAGFTWQKSKQFKNKNEWEAYLNDFSKKIKTPLKVTM